MKDIEKIIIRAAIFAVANKIIGNLLDKAGL